MKLTKTKGLKNSALGVITRCTKPSLVQLCFNWVLNILKDVLLIIINGDGGILVSCHRD